MFLLLKIATIIGIQKFLRHEVLFRKNLRINVNKSRIFPLIKHFKENVITSEENYKLKLLMAKENIKPSIIKEEKMKLHTHIFFTDDGKIMTEDEYKDSIANII